jgi:hypothetical protein
MGTDYKLKGTEFPLLLQRPNAMFTNNMGLRFEKLSVSLASLQSLGTTS